MAQPLRTGQFRKNFLADIDSAEGLVSKVRTLSNINPGGPVRSLHAKQVLRVVELAFLGIVAEWEDFLEQTFVRYLAGATSDNGYIAPHKFGQTNGMMHSYSLLSHDTKYDPLKHFLRFSDPSWCVLQSEFFFVGGGPYASIRNAMPRLKEANLIRNRIAHSSKKCKADFKDVAISYVNPLGATLGQGYRVGNLLSAPAIRHFGPSAHGGDYFKAFCDLYRRLAIEVCPK